MKIKLSEIENKFFRVVQYVGFGFASLAAIVFLVMSLIVLGNFMSSADETVKPAQFSVKDYQKILKDETTLDEHRNIEKEKQSSADNTQEQGKSETPNKELKLLGEVVENFKEYSEEFDQNPPSTAEQFENYINQNLRGLEQDLISEYINQLHKASKDLAELKKDEVSEVIQWDKFLNWQLKSYLEKILEEYARIEQEQTDAQKANMAALTMLPFLFALLAVFLVFTLILVMLRIEKNTRKNNN